MISVIVPVYKSEKTLVRCVESLLAQREEELEILLVDDGSPDGCPGICDDLARRDPRIRVLHKENGGVSSARNAGLQAAMGIYVQFVDSDDYVEPDYCHAMRQALEKSKGFMAVCGYHHHYVGSDVEKLPRAKETLLDLYKEGFLNMPWNKLFLRELTGSFPEDLSLGEDLLFNFQYLMACRGAFGREEADLSGSRVVLVERPLYHYIQEETGQSLSDKKRRDKLKLAKRIRKEAEEFFLSEAFLEKEGESLGEEEKRAIYQVVETRFLCECLDDVERLPFDREMTGRQKREEIRRLCKDKQVRRACRLGRPGPLDYRVIQWSLGHGFAGLTWLLSLLRSFVVRARRKCRGNASPVSNGSPGKRQWTDEL